MIEVNSDWDLLPNSDQHAYGEIAQRPFGAILMAPGLNEVRALADWFSVHD